MPNPRMCPHCRAFIDPKAGFCPYCENEVGASYRQKAQPDQPALRGLVPQSHFTTFILLAINFGIFLVTMVLSMQLGSDDFLSVHGGVLNVFGAKERIAIVLYDQWWRLVTAGFLHGGIIHLLMNSWVLFGLGVQVEEVFGTARYLVIYLLSSVIGFLVSLYWTPAMSIGSSAALSGLIGAMMAYAKRTGQDFIWSFYLRRMIIIAVLGLIIPAIDNAAHFGGFVGGFGIGFLAASRRVTPDSETLWKAAATLLCVATAGSMAMAYRTISEALNSL